MLEIVYKGYTIELLEDECENPRESMDNLGKMFCSHPRYNFGDEQYGDGIAVYEAALKECGFDPESTPLREESLSNTEYLNRLKDELKDRAFFLPVYIYDHSGVTMNTTGYQDKWDSSEVGVVFCSFEKAKKEYGSFDQDPQEMVLSILNVEIDLYDKYLRGDVYRLNIKNKNGEEVYSVGGYYGEEDTINEAKKMINFRSFN